MRRSNDHRGSRRGRARRRHVGVLAAPAGIPRGARGAAPGRHHPRRGAVRLGTATATAVSRSSSHGRLAEGARSPARAVPWPGTSRSPALLAGHTDVISPGCRSRRRGAAQVAFADPSFLTAIAGCGASRGRAEGGRRPRRSCRTSPRIGVKKGTTGEAFVRQRRPDENIVVYRRSRDAITELRGLPYRRLRRRRARDRSRDRRSRPATSPRTRARSVRSRSPGRSAPPTRTCAAPPTPRWRAGAPTGRDRGPHELAAAAGVNAPRATGVSRFVS